jgi:transposase
LKTLKQHIRKLSKKQFQELTRMSFESRKLYNCALYFCKNYYKETGKYIGYNKLYHQMKTNEHYKNIKSNTAQQILRLVDKNYRSFFALLRRKKIGKYLENIKEPGFKPKNSQFILIFPIGTFRIRKNILTLTKKIKIPFSFKIQGTLKQYAFNMKK